MQLKGLVRFFTILLIAYSLYQLSFTYFVKSHEKKMEARARSYVKFIYYGAERTGFDPAIRSFNKPGDAYGFMIDAAYIADLINNVEFLLSAVIHCNSDGIYNDDNYDYQTIGYPFMKNLGRVIYEHELKRSRRFKPDLSEFNIEYRP